VVSERGGEGGQGGRTQIILAQMEKRVKTFPLIGLGGVHEIPLAGGGKKRRSIARKGRRNLVKGGVGEVKWGRETRLPCVWSAKEKSSVPCKN